MKNLYFKLFSGLLVVVMLASTFGTASANPGSTIDFEGFAEGDFVSSVASGSGISGDPLAGYVTVFGFNPLFKGTNAAMIFDATCTGGCSGGADDLYGPAQGNVLIVSDDLNQSDPKDSTNGGVYFEFEFSNLEWGLVTVESLVVGDIDPYQSGANIKLFSGNILLATIPIPVNGDAMYNTIPIGVAGVDRMRVYTKGSGAIDDLKFKVEPFPSTKREILYLSDSTLPKDGKSKLFQVNIDQVGAKAKLTLLPNGILNYNQVDVLSATPDGSRLYFMDDGAPALQKATLAYYDVASATVHEIGVVTANGANVWGFDQAAFSPDGTMYAASVLTEQLYRINLDTAEATEVGKVINQATGLPLNIAGADLAFTYLGEAYFFTNQNGDTHGLYQISIPPGQGDVIATYISRLDDGHLVRGLAVRANGFGDLTASTESDDLHVMDRATGTDAFPPLLFYLNGVVFDAKYGDMSLGPFMLCNTPMKYWRDYPWEGIRVTVLGVNVYEALGKKIMVNAHKWNFSQLFAELIAAKLNTNNSTGLAVIDEAEAWMEGQGLLNPNGTLNWSKPFSSAEQKAQANAYVLALQVFNVTNTCSK